MKDKFRLIANRISNLAGSAMVFVAAVFIILLWAATGPFVSFSDTWQLVINTGTTIVTFLMVFLIQNTQNRDSRAMHLKLDELIRSHKTARDTFVSLEDISDEELLEIATEFKNLHEDKAPTEAMRKLQKKIVAEHAMRQSLGGTAKRMAGAFLDPLHLHKDNKKES